MESVECGTCQGQGIMNKKMQLFVRIPKSVEDGMLLKIREKGN